MGPPTTPPDDRFPELLRRAGQGDLSALGELFGEHRARLRRMVQARLDRRVQGRLDPSDVLQEAYLEVSRALPDYLRNPDLPFFLWLRMVTGRKLQALHRHHLGTRMRDAGREASPRASSDSLVDHLVGGLTSPSRAAARAELRTRVREALDGMEALDREVLSLRHFEQLGNAETAAVLGITEKAASNRFVRALRRLKEVLDGHPGVSDRPGEG